MASELEVGKVKVAPTDSTASVELYRNDSSIANGNAIGDINFGGADADNATAARIRAKADGGDWTASSSPTALEFAICPVGSEQLATRLVIANNGTVSFSGGGVQTYTDSTLNWGNTSSHGRITWTNSVPATGDGAAIVRGLGNKELHLGANNDTSVKIATTGLVTFEDGIAFSQTNSTAASNITSTLDHYERGVWTPVIADAATGGNTGSGSTVTGYYERVGNAVTVNGLATNVDTSGMTGTNVLFVRGLPFPAGYSSGTFSNLGRAVGSCVLDSVDVDTSTRSVSTMVTGQNSYFTFHQIRDAVGDSNILVSNLSSGAADLFFSFTYFVD